MTIALVFWGLHWLAGTKSSEVHNVDTDSQKLHMGHIQR